MAKMVSVSTYNTANIGGRKPLGKASPLANSFSLIEYDKNHRFLIMDCPTNSTIPLYLKEFARLNVTDVVRVCEPTYMKERVETRNVKVHDLPFKDGDVPPASVLKQWLELVTMRVASTKGEEGQEPTTIAVHCVAGLGRAPVLVAVALIEKGMDPLDAIEHVRHKRRGAFNNRQITYLADSYKRTGFKGTTKISSAMRSSPLSSTNASTMHGDKAPVAPSSIHKSFFKKMFGSH
ncbi:hypothetical protein LPJ77_004732 [Coemansia sp. RSA 2523]|nr:hypothetical protein LPJ58_004516 [Coemansia sp. RSA 1591]KAJ1757339.1 hypothetical protein LPJ69_004452 [Coemansia sp. RSA 1752]KAJ1780545.1 hypothetical protein LPJ54_000065 [Coemansia sp. RSA 1824]KAJ1784295.1 hypothetical protein LPJ67_004389 [Coemansia sp. RSA 1938]KAJ1789278.1 hypothetical protein LPJ62_002501 [Coemansia sp. RSA 2167]KAJ1804506.1 hypothetical protein LPJ77_004732 [Coemansia sp. RSA 2523]KAJ2139835.1 hypothetical protein GGH17_000210 [Coemansia sp. RSA 788]KAJ2145387